MATHLQLTVAIALNLCLPLSGAVLAWFWLRSGRRTLRAWAFLGGLFAISVLGMLLSELLEFWRLDTLQPETPFVYVWWSIALSLAFLVLAFLVGLGVGAITSLRDWRCPALAVGCTALALAVIWSQSDLTLLTTHRVSDRSQFYQDHPDIVVFFLLHTQSGELQVIRQDAHGISVITNISDPCSTDRSLLADSSESTASIWTWDGFNEDTIVATKRLGRQVNQTPDVDLAGLNPAARDDLPFSLAFYLTPDLQDALTLWAGWTVLSIVDRRSDRPIFRGGFSVPFIPRLWYGAREYWLGLAIQPSFLGDGVIVFSLGNHSIMAIDIDKDTVYTLGPGFGPVAGRVESRSSRSMTRVEWVTPVLAALADKPPVAPLN